MIMMSRAEFAICKSALRENFWRTNFQNILMALNTLLNIFSFIGLNAILTEEVKA
jgi:hypothetical protein